MELKCDRCHKKTKDIILVNLTDYNGVNNGSITTAKICPKCSHQLRDWLWQGEELEN